MPKPTNYNHRYQLNFQETEVQTLGGTYVQIRNSPQDGQLSEEQLMRFYFFNAENSKMDYVKAGSIASLAAEIAGLSPHYRFKNQAERRHVMSAWYKKVNPGYSDKVKARNLYDPQNRPEWWPKDVEYCSPTNKKKNGDGKLLDKELMQILESMRPILFGVLLNEYLALSQKTRSDISKIALPEEVKNKLEGIVVPPQQRAKSPKVEQITIKKEETTIKQETQFVHQETQSSDQHVNILLPRAHLGYSGSAQPNPQHEVAVPLPIKPDIKTEDLSTLEFGSIYQDTQGQSPSMMCTVQSDAIQHALEVTVVTEPEPEIPAVPTTVEEFQAELPYTPEMEQNMLTTERDAMCTDMLTPDQLGQLEACVKSNKDFQDFLGQIEFRQQGISAENQVLFELKDKCFVEEIEHPRALTPNTQIFASHESANQMPLAVPPEVQMRRPEEHTQPVVAAMQPAVHMQNTNFAFYQSEPSMVVDTAGNMGSVNSFMPQTPFSGFLMNNNANVAPQNPASLGFELALVPEDEAMEVDSYVKGFPNAVIGVNDTQPASFTDVLDLALDMQEDM